MHRKATYNIAVGLALKELHDERHIERNKLAEALEIDELAVTRIEHGEERMTAGELVLMLEAFRLTWDDFMQRVRKHLVQAESQVR